MIIHTCEQRSEEWYALRLGKFTASDFDILMANTRDKSGWSDTQRKIIYRVAAERMTGLHKVTYKSLAMDHGANQESEAIVAYSIQAGVDVEKVGFVERDEWVGCSPDGLIGDHSTLEIKCPESETHLYYRANPWALEEKYRYQIQGQLWITGREWCEVVSYDPRMKDNSKRLLCKTIGRNQEQITALNCRIVSAIEMAKKIMEA